jgi:catalase
VTYTVNRGVQSVIYPGLGDFTDWDEDIVAGYANLVFVKFHWKPKQGMQSVVWNEALKLNGADPDHHRRDLWDAIQMGDYPEWELGLQLFDQAFADSFDFDVLDATKIIPEEVLPVRRVGRLVLDRVVDNFFAETEQVAFCTQNIVPGIDFTNDPLLQGRNFSYLDTQLKRLGGPNFHEIPVNRPRGCPFSNFQQDGHMRMTVPKGRANYEPNSWGEGPRESPEKGFRSYPAEEAGAKLRIRPESFADHYSQARQFYISQTAIEQGHIAAALTFELSKVETPAIRARVVSHLLNIDQALGEKVAAGLRLKQLPAPANAAVPTRTDLKESPALSILLNGPESFAGRKVGALVTDGADMDLLKALKSALDQEGALLKLVAPMVGGIEASDGTWLEADEKIDGGPSVLFDAVALIPSREGAALLAKEATARDFVADAFAHMKFIGYVAAAEPLLEKAGVLAERDQGFVPLAAADDAKAFVAACRKLRFWQREAKVKQV